MIKRICFFVLCGLLLISTDRPAVFAAELTGEAEAMFKAYQAGVYQVRVIFIGSGEKNAIGSGFQVSADGLVVTNYHVVSQAVLEPDRYRVEYLSHDNQSGTLTILDVDAVHDLAVLKMEKPTSKFFELGSSQMDKGARIYSFGNPFDLGMTIVDGIYNGLMQEALYKKILFSGSINPGMSGGPAVGADGKLIGVNVATSGNQISFFVPVEFLADLLKRVADKNQKPVAAWQKHIESQLVSQQKTFISQILAAPWKTMTINAATVPGELTKQFKCWGESYDQKKSWVTGAYTQCSTDDEIFLSPEFSTGKISFRYMWLESRTPNPPRFYNVYEGFFGRDTAFENAGEEDVENFKCHEDFINVHGVNFKASFCARKYKKYPALFDVLYNLASIHNTDGGLLMELRALGVTEPEGVALTRQLTENIDASLCR